MWYVWFMVLKPFSFTVAYNYRFVFNFVAKVFQHDDVSMHKAGVRKTRVSPTRLL